MEVFSSVEDCGTKRRMVVKSIENVDVEFPFEPYDCQLTYMAKVIQALDMKCDAALESPTGTGKTLSLLCSTLAWIQKQKMILAPTFQQVMTMENDKSSSAPIRNPLIPRVYYCSRTHSQLAQVARELNKTMYKIMPTSFLASREQLCIHDKVSKEKDNTTKAVMCRSLVSKHSCHYYNKWDLCSSDKLQKIYGASGDILDIEDLVTIAKQHSHCPYFRSRQMTESAELILLPYNYLISPQLRQIHRIDLKGSIVIFDEAHNLESICEECVSVELSTTDVAMCIRELQKAIEVLQEKLESIRTEMDNAGLAFGSGLEGKSAGKQSEPPFEIGTAAIVLNMLFEFEKHIDEAYADTKSARTFHEFPGKVFAGEYLLSLLSKAQFTSDKAFEMGEMLRKASDFLHEYAETMGPAFAERGGYLQKLGSFLAVVYSGHSEEAVAASADPTIKMIDRLKPAQLAKDFKLYMVKEKEGDDEQKKITLKYWCFTASLAMKQLKQRGVRSIIVTSGTLSPLPNFMTNIGLDFGCTLENGHAAGTSQVVAGLIKRGPIRAHQTQGEPLNGNFANRSNESYHLAVGDSMLKLARAVPQGILVFFSSYALMNQMLASLKSRSATNKRPIWDQLADLKTLVVEPTRKNELSAVRLEFTTAVRGDKGAMFFAVCRGKVSEGIDFADADSRAVLIVGIPYPPVADPRIRLKRIYMDEKRANNPKAQSSDQWYQTEGYRAVNQAIGRVLRHVNDFGIVALLDSRFSSANFGHFPAWMRPSMRVFEKYEEFDTVVNTFFRERGVQVQKSRQGLLERSYSDVGKTMRKRARKLVIEQEPEFNYGDNIIVADGPPNISDKADSSVKSLGELQDDDRGSSSMAVEKVLLPAAFGSVAVGTNSAATASSQPVRKKIKLGRNSAIGTFGSQQPMTSSSGATSQQAPPTRSTTVSDITQEQDGVRVLKEIKKDLPSGYAAALKMPGLQLKAMMKEHGLQREMCVLLKQLKEGTPFETILLRMADLMLPAHGKLFLATSQYFSTAERDVALKYAMDRDIKI